MAESKASDPQAISRRSAGTEKPPVRQHREAARPPAPRSRRSASTEKPPVRQHREAARPPAPKMAFVARNEGAGPARELSRADGTSMTPLFFVLDWLGPSPEPLAFTSLARPLTRLGATPSRWKCAWTPPSVRKVGLRVR
jgi:hypothetical protein